MCDEVIFRGRYLHTIEDLQSALGGGEIVPDRQCGYTEDDLLPHCCLCPVDLAQTAAKHGLRLWPSSDGEGVWILSDEVRAKLDEVERAAQRPAGHWMPRRCAWSRRCCMAVERLRAEAEARLTVAQQPAEQHPDDAAVDRFAAAMKAKLKKKRQEGRAGWQFMASEQLSALLHEHVRKGDPVDVANLAMMLHQNGQVIEPPAAVVTDEMKETDLWRCTVCGRFGTVGRCCGEETRERANMEQLLAENERLLRELRQETERRWEGNRRAAKEYVDDMRDVLREAAQICKDLDEEALAKEGRLACGAECAGAIADLAVRWNVPFFEEQKE